MIIICGKTIAEVERDLEMAKMAIASGAPMGIGGATIGDAEKAMEMLRNMMGGEVAPISNPNYIGVPPIEDIYCPNCDEPYDGEYCENCGYGCEDEDECCHCDKCDCECGHSCCCDEEDEPCEDEGVSAEDVDEFAKDMGLPPVWADWAKRVLGL